MNCFFQTQSVAKAVKEFRYEDAVELRGKSFQNNLEIYRLLNNRHVPEEAKSMINAQVGFLISKHISSFLHAQKSLNSFSVGAFM